jgi:molybdopterin molybdotransferase
MAEQAIGERLSMLPAEIRALELCIGRTLRQDVYAERDNPPFDRVCMDGIAIASGSGGRRAFAIEAFQAAGAPVVSLSKPENAIEVMTGAMLPRGTDCVIPVEEYELTAGVASLKDPVLFEPFRNVQRRGSDSKPGEPMLKSGARLGAPEIAVVASAGLAHVSVGRQPTFMVISTGNELVEPGQPIAEHQIRRSNAYAVVAALREHGFDQIGNDHIPDDEETLRDRLAGHLQERDVLILSGGVSKGRFDLVPKVLKALHVQEVFHQIAQRPGMPMWFGVTARGGAVFGLPGNPVSTLICLARYVVPAVVAAMGAEPAPPETIRLARAVKRGRPVASFVPVSVRYDENGEIVALPIVPSGSGDFLALAGTHGFVELPPQADPYPEGFVARLYRW